MKNRPLELALFYLTSTLIGIPTAHAAEPKDTINNYLTDISGGSVSAAGLVGGAKSPVTTIESSQDLILAVQPFASEETRKGGFGIAFTPAKSTLLPMAGNTYVNGGTFMRLLGNLTLSYAQNAADFGGKSYRRSAYSLNTVYYFNVKDDPVYLASEGFKECADKTAPDNDAAIAAIVRADPPLSKAERLLALEALTDKRAPVLLDCIDKKLAGAKWNSARASLSLGEGRIRGDSGAASYSLGRSWNLNAQLPAGAKGLVQLSMRETRNALDPNSLGKPALAFKTSRLSGVRFTYGDQEATDLRLLVEASDSKSGSAGAFRDTFMAAIGIDKRLAQGAWLEFRFGRNRTLEGGKEQNMGLLTLNISPTLLTYKK
jgi:hypothetical protein